MKRWKNGKSQHIEFLTIRFFSQENFQGVLACKLLLLLLLSYSSFCHLLFSDFFLRNRYSKKILSSLARYLLWPWRIHSVQIYWQAALWPWRTLCVCGVCWLVYRILNRGCMPVKLPALSVCQWKKYKTNQRQLCAESIRVSKEQRKLSQPQHDANHVSRSLPSAYRRKRKAFF